MDEREILTEIRTKCKELEQGISGADLLLIEALKKLNEIPLTGIIDAIAEFEKEASYMSLRWTP